MDFGLWGCAKADILGWRGTDGRTHVRTYVCCISYLSTNLSSLLARSVGFYSRRDFLPFPVSFRRSSSEGFDGGHFGLLQMLILVLLGASGAEPILAPVLPPRAGGGGAGAGASLGGEELHYGYLHRVCVGEVEDSLVVRYIVVVVVVVVVVVDGVFYRSPDAADYD